MIGSLSGGRPQERIVARQENLEEIVVIQLAIAVQIEVVDHEYEVLGGHFSVAIFPFELANLLGADVACAIPIDPFEGRVGLEIADGSQDLAHLLDGKLLFGHEKEQFFEFQL